MNRVGLVWMIWAFPLLAAAQADNLCAVLNREYGRVQTIEIRAVLKSAMHGTYLSQDGCDRSLLLVLPEEIPGYKGPVKTVKDQDFSRFLDARNDHRPDAPKFEATFCGNIETASGRGEFGYYRNKRLRLVLRSVAIEPGEQVVISDPPMIGKRPTILRRIWNVLTKAS
jgi:hypothetical protein